MTLGERQTRRVAVIIPYFQRDPGILGRALTSVREQDMPPGWAAHTYVVDDGSPRPARMEIGDGTYVTLISQMNAGPGAARNTALDRMWSDGGADLVAFLDSDDIWEPRHLADAIAALQAGYDFYCCDNSRSAEYGLFSDQTPALRDRGRALVERSVQIDENGPVRGFEPNTLSDEIAVEYLSHTSTVVVRAEGVRTLRFDPDLRNAGEDRMFWLQLSLAGARIAISWRCNVICGSGVNLFFSAYDWNSTQTLEKFASQLLFSEKLKRQRNVSEKRYQFAIQRIRNCRRAYSFLFVRSMIKLRRPPFASLKRLLAFDPILPLRMPILFLGVLLDRRPPDERLQAE